ncbi:MAG: LytTR family transcriptional regulator DNA-binding domain-containing protein [Tannerellaceae bacterium]|jgi:hypothetical protein|nr:LytTR family transcriptional regulator DNA-binding domain-containing protein [Tannerellaceae bacterium]
MLPHPFAHSRLRIFISLVLYLHVVGVLGGLLVLYGRMGAVAAFTDAGVFIGLLAVCGFLSWFFFTYIRPWQAQIVLSLFVQLLCLGGCYMVVTLGELETTYAFGKTLPLRLVTSILYWFVLMQYYHILQIKEEKRENEKELPEETDVPAGEPAEWLDRISVKDGVRIHLVQVEELLYIQACGDYVTLFTQTGQYVKEQTMKYFDVHLPPSAFVRIHRSTIVNVNHIQRVELFGKESYCVRLKNGVSLRVSGAGYKLLKERLGL